MRKIPSVILTILCIGGCAVQKPREVPPAMGIAATQPSLSPESNLPLSEIPPQPKLADLKPATQPSSQPSLDAIELFARARGAMIDNQRFSAISLLQRAIQADPYSFELRFALGKAYAGDGTHGAEAVAAFEAAAGINPDDLSLQVELGRQYLARNDFTNALTHLRLALQTTEYQSDEETASLADLYLARTLQQKGYDRAALDQYNLLLNRLERSGAGFRGSQELAFIAARPEGLYIDVAQLYAKHNQYDQALKAYQFVADHNPENFEIQARIVNTLLEMNRPDDAVRKSLDVVGVFKANAESLELLKSVYKQLGRESAVVDELRKLYGQKPADHGILFALSDTLDGFGRRSEAIDLLTRALERDPRSQDIFRKLFALYDSHDETEGAARVWIEYLAQHPDSMTELSPLWDRVIRPSRKNNIRLTTLQKLQVSPLAQGTKLFLVSRQASLWNRDALARTAMEQATRARPIFPPAFRAQMSDIWLHQDWDSAKKIAETKTLVEAARSAGENSLAAELEGRSLSAQGDANGAIAAFAQATQLGNASPDLQLTYAGAVGDQGNKQRFEQLMWKLISDRPGYEQAYIVLFYYYLNPQQNSPNQARKVLSTWLAADPTSIRGRLLQATILAEVASGPGGSSAQIEAAEGVFLEVFRENPDSAEVLESLKDFYVSHGKVPQFIELLEDERLHHPANRAAIEYLVGIYGAQKRLPDAARVLDAARAAIGDDPDLLYYIAHLYERIDQPQTTEEILARVIRIEPGHAAANNDLGYSWTDEGKNLDKAESMIRIAVEAEPDNESFLDSLGWVLYKRANFAEARQYFERAIAPASFPDPVVLDHLGDTLYRLHESKLARDRWNAAMERIVLMADAGTLRDELMKLRLTLINKIRQTDQGQPVTVAPTAEAPPKGDQAKN